MGIYGINVFLLRLGGRILYSIIYSILRSQSFPRIFPVLVSLLKAAVLLAIGVGAWLACVRANQCNFSVST